MGGPPLSGVRGVQSLGGSMKEILAIVALALCSSIASAVPVTINCSQIVSTVPPANNSAPSDCPGFGDLGAVTINSLNMQWAFDFMFNPFEAGTPQVTFAADAPGSSFDLAGIIATQGNRPASGSAISGNPAADYALLQNAFQVIGSWTAISPPVTGVTLDFRFNLDYTAVPEPATFVLIGAGLVGLGILRRRLA